MKPTYKIHRGDCLKLLEKIDVKTIGAIVSDPPYGMNWNPNSARFTKGKFRGSRGAGRMWPKILGDDKPFDPAPWLRFKKVVLWGANHYGARLPVGTTLVWIKKGDHVFGTFLSDAEIAWQKGGHGVYCFRKNFNPSTRAKEGGFGRCLHPTQKPVDLMKWCIQRLRLPKGSTIFDPYMGSGSTAVAALELGHPFLGCELDPTYFRVAKKRIDATMLKWGGGGTGKNPGSIRA